MTNITTQGTWIVLSNIGGELDRTFVADKGSEGANRRAWQAALAEMIVDVGDTITIEAGESEIDTAYYEDRALAADYAT